MAATSGRGIRDRFDPRLLIGVLLVAGSAAGVVAIIGSVDDGSRVWAASAALMPGQRIDTDDLVERRVRLGEAGPLYAAVGDASVPGSIVQQPVRAGELVPSAALGTAESAAFAPIVLSLRGELSRSILPGATVDVWAARQVGIGSWSAPAVIAPGVLVVRIAESQTVSVGGAELAVEVLIPRNRLAAVLEARANGDALSLVPASSGTRAGSIDAPPGGGTGTGPDRDERPLTDAATDLDGPLAPETPVVETPVVDTDPFSPSASDAAAKAHR